MGNRATAESERVPVDSLPNPVVGYSLDGGEPVIELTNEACENAFDSPSTATTVEQWIRTALGVDEPTARRVCSTLSGTETTVEADTSQFRLRRLPAPDAPLDGYLLVRKDGVEADRIASIISHDLRNPLDVAMAHLRAARETGDAEHFDEVSHAHDRIGQIIQDVLTLARGEQALDVVPDVDLGRVATDAWATVDTETAALSVDDSCPIDADPDRLQRLFENLFRNTVEHGSGSDQAADGISVRVGTMDGGFFVADDGVGIAPADRSHVFDPGYTANEAENGTGLGLTIVEQIAEAHDWTVTLSTGDAGGVRFEFTTRNTELADSG